MQALVARWVKILGSVALVAALVTSAVYIHLYNTEKQTRETQEAATKGLPPGILAKYILQNRELTTMIKNAQGKTTVVVQYVPDEAGVQVVTKDKQALQDKYNALMNSLLNAKTPQEVSAIQKSLGAMAGQINTPDTVTVKTWGLTSRFGYGIVVSGGARTQIPYSGGALNIPAVPALDWKFAYAGRYSALWGVNPVFTGPEITRHIDDYTPGFLHVNNLELGVTGGLGWTGSKYLGMVLRSNF